MLIKIRINDAQIITKKAAPFDFAGKTGISRKVDLLIEQEVQKFSVSEDAFDELVIGTTVDLIAELFMSTNKSSIKLVGIAD